MIAVRIAAGFLIAFVCAVSALDISSKTAGRIRNGEPLIGMLEVRHIGQPSVTPPALYLVVAGTRAGSLDLVRIPSDTPVFEHNYEGKRKNRRTLADVYANEGQSMSESALTMLQSDSAWPENTTEGPESTRPTPLDFHLSFSLPSNVRPGFPREMKHVLSEALQKPLFWPEFASRGPRSKDKPAYDRLLLAREFRRIKPDRIRLSELTDPDLSNRLLSRVFARSRGHGEIGGQVDVEVLNASDTSGLALKATRLLRLRGFDVKHFGNARAPEKSSRFLDRSGNAIGADAVAAALGCHDSEVLTSLVESPRASVSVLLGRDFTECSELAAKH